MEKITEIKRLQHLAGINEITINKPLHGKVVISKNTPVTGIEGYKNFIEDYGHIINYLEPIVDEKYESNEGLGEELVKIILINMHALDDKYGYGFQSDYYKEWIDQYINDIGLQKQSSGSFWTAMLDDEWLYDETIAEIFNIDEDSLYDLYEEYKTW